MIRDIIISLGEDGHFIAEVPSLPGCISQGKTAKEAEKNICEAMKLYIETLKEDNIPIPNNKTIVLRIPDHVLNYQNV